MLHFHRLHRRRHRLSLLHIHRQHSCLSDVNLSGRLNSFSPFVLQSSPQTLSVDRSLSSIYISTSAQEHTPIHWYAIDRWWIVKICCLLDVLTLSVDVFVFIFSHRLNDKTQNNHI